MILGSVSFSHDGIVFPIAERIRKMTDYEGLTFHQVSCEGLAGGYYLNHRLPHTTAGLFYTDKENDILVLLSGSVYNKEELCNLVNITGPVTDPELIALLFRCEGPDFVRRLNGDFAIFILRQKLKQAYLFRDQAGIRPMAWAIDQKSLCFSSDTIGLCRAFSDTKAIDIDYLLGFFKYIDYRKTPDKNVKRLLPGHYLHYSEKGIELTRYWYPERIKIAKNLSYDLMLSELDTILRDSVKIRCDSRFTAGAHVSSGLDSGIVSGLARRECSRQGKFYGFSWSPHEADHSEIKYDERDLVVRFCEKTGITPVFSDLSPDRFTQIISSLYGNPGLFYEDRTAEQAAELGTNLLFSGWGGDEFISTGDRGVEQDLLAGLKLKVFFRRNPVRPLRNFIKNQLLYVIYPALGVLDRVTAKSFRDDARYLKKAFTRSDGRAIRNFYFHTSRRRMHLRMLQFYHLQRRCESWMINGYRTGVEYRYPLLDKRIIEYMLKVPSELLCRTNQFRPLLRELGKDILTDEIRLNYSKTDPVSISYTRELYKASALSSMDEASEWRDNSYLSFIDFGLLDQDIRAFRESPDRVNGKVFFKALVNIKAVNEISKNY